ncbi:MAG: hypothetical protein JWP75_2506 [Frondihabitans sp.]|nr:hypothetical protein [Frondihabitans sp.]
MKTPILPLAGLSIIAALALAGCTSGSSEADSTKPPSPVVTQDAKPGTSESHIGKSGYPKAGKTPGNMTPPSKKVAAKCVDGTATIDSAISHVTLTGECDTVQITEAARQSYIDLGTVTHVVVSNNLSRINIASADDLIIYGNANDIVYDGTKPSVDDKGAENLIVAK